MKILKQLSTFFFFSILFGACFDPPTFPVTPEIEFKSIVFVEGKTFIDNDSLNLTIRFKDGDGDLGLPANEIDQPYNNLNLFLVNNGELEAVGTTLRYNDLPPFIDPAPGQTGKLASVRTRNDPGFGSLPPYTIPYSCINYIYDSVYISEEDKNIFDGSYNLYKTLTAPNLPNVYVLLDTFYYELNTFHNNITVDFLVKNNDGTFSEFDWASEFCVSDNAPGISFDGRFPVLAEKSGPLEGELKYAMVSSGFLALFSVKTLKLRIQVYDRALNKSNIIETPEFTLR